MSVMSRSDVVTLVRVAVRELEIPPKKPAGTLTLMFSSSVGYLNFSLILAQGNNV